ncbi:MAG: hypothetical protein ACFFCS_23255 [Candidatus Hodarchaeota archaeon]
MLQTEIFKEIEEYWASLEEYWDYLGDNWELLVIILVLGHLSYSLPMAIWASIDAKQNRRNRVLWFWAIFYLGFIPFIVYMAKTKAGADKILKERGKPVQVIVEINTMLSRILSSMVYMVIFTIYGIFPLIALYYGAATFLEIWMPLAVAIALIGLMFIISWAGASNRFGAMVTVFGNLGGLLLIYDLVYSDNDLTIDPSYSMVKLVIFYMILGGAFSGLLNSLIMWFAPKNIYHKNDAFNLRMKRRLKKDKLKTILVFSLIAGLPTMGIISAVPQVYTQKITITPQDYQAEIAFWGRYEFVCYNTTVKEQLNNHNATIVYYNTHDIRSAFWRNNITNDLTLWNTTYPNVKFIPTIPSITRINNTGDDNLDFYWGGFPGDWSAEGTIKYAKEYIQLAVNNSLTNVVGINTDQEAPPDALEEIYNINTDPDPVRHTEANQMYDEFFDWVDANYPDMFMTTTVGNHPFIDVYDDDFDVHVKERHNVLDVDAWDEIAPMIYRCGCEGDPPHGGGPDDVRVGGDITGSYGLYQDLKFLDSALRKVYGNADKLGVYLGITNLSCYSADSAQCDKYGNPLGTGYDELVKDALIAKHFGSKIITIFILDTVIDEDGCYMGGVFDSYGDDFLDRFMNDINGPGSTTPFEIYFEPDLDFLRDFNKDMIYELGSPVGIALICVYMAVIILFAVLLYPPVKKRVFKKKSSQEREFSRKND